MNNFNYFGTYFEVCVNGSPWAVLNIIIFVFFGLIFNIRVSQYEESVFRQFYNPILDLDRIIKSSAYRSEFILVPFGRTNGSDIVFSKKYGKLLI